MSKLALRILLSVLGRLLTRASRTNPNFRAALSRDRTIVITGGGVAHHYRIHERRITAVAGPVAGADCTLRFDTAARALGALLSPQGVGKIIQGALRGTVQIDGDIVLLLWFEGRIQQVVPIREPIRRPVRLPGAYLAPRDDNRASAWITREPAVAELDPNWHAAWAQRDKLWMVRVAGGEPLLEI